MWQAFRMKVLLAWCNVNVDPKSSGTIVCIHCAQHYATIGAELLFRHIQTQRGRNVAVTIFYLALLLLV